MHRKGQLVWFAGTGQRKFLGGRTNLKDTQPVSQVLTLRSAHAWGLMLYEILNPVALSLICVFCMKDSGAHAQGLEPQLSAVLPAASLSPREGFSAACLRLVELGSSGPGRERAAHCCHPPSPAETRHGRKESQGWACAPLCLGQDGICSQPGLTVP